MDIVEQKQDEAINNIIKVYLAQMNSALKISKIICEHSNEEELTGDHIICGLIYRLMVPMTDEDMSESLNKADNILNDLEDETDESDSDEEISYDIPKEKVNQVFKKIATKTHPDKTRGGDDSDRLEELYKDAQQSVERNDWSRVTKIAEELNIDISNIEENDDVYFETTSKKLRKKIDDTQQTLAVKNREYCKHYIPQLVFLNSESDNNNNLNHIFQTPPANKIGLSGISTSNNKPTYGKSARYQALAHNGNYSGERPQAVPYSGSNNPIFSNCVSSFVKFIYQQ